MHPALSLGIGLLFGAAVISVMPGSWLFIDHPDAINANDPDGARYACPMMDFIGTHPGLCPVCGMKMERVTAGEITRAQRKRMGVETVTIASQPAEVFVRADGVAEYDHRSTTMVIPRVAGRIVKRHEATFGCCIEVGADEPIIDLYSPEAFAAQGELKTAVKLGDKSLIAQLRARFERWNLVDVADAVIAGKEPVDTVTIRSPVGGQVWLEHIDQLDENLLVGKEIPADMPLIRLVDPDLMTMIVHIPENEAHFITDAQVVDLYTDDGRKIGGAEAFIGLLAREIDPTTRTVEARIYISKANKLVRPGALITARIHGQLDKNLQPIEPDDKAHAASFAVIPKAAVLSTGVRHVAWKLDGEPIQGKQQYAPVSLWLGPRIEDVNGNDVYIVRAGLSPGDRVAARGAFLIDSQAQLAGTPSLLFPTGAAAPASGHQH